MLSSVNDRPSISVSSDGVSRPLLEDGFGDVSALDGDADAKPPCETCPNCGLHAVIPTLTVWFALAVGAVACAGHYIGLQSAPVDLPAWPIALLAGTTVFLGMISHLLADALLVGRGAHAFRPFRLVSLLLPLGFGLLRAGTHDS
jgi:hypothetical protein